MRVASRTLERPAVFGGPLERCPSCGATELVAVHDWDDTNFLCTTCDRCWHIELSYVLRVDPLTCRDCSRRPGCVERFGTDLAAD